MIEKFKQKAQEFIQAFRRLFNTDVSGLPPEYAKRKKELLDEGNIIKRVIESGASATDMVTALWDRITGNNATQATKDALNGVMMRNGQLGAIPLLAPLAISGVVAYIGNFLSRVYLFERQVSEQRRLEETGMSAQQAASIVKDKVKEPNAIADAIKLPLTVGIGFFALRFLKII